MNPYTLSNEELVKKALNCALKAGSSHSGIAIDVMRQSDMEDVQYFHGALLARFADSRPPIKEGVAVTVPDGKTVWGQSRYITRSIGEGQYIVKKIWYMNSQWHLSLSGHERDREGMLILFPCEEFTLPSDEAEPNTENSNLQNSIQ